MINSKDILLVEIQEARAKAFYLIKKYTSYTYLDQARNLYQQFLDAFERQLRNPPKEVQQHQYAEHLQKRHESEYIHYLEKMSHFKNGLKIIEITSYKKDGYYMLLKPNYTDWMFDRYADENSVADDPFYILLGLGYSRSTDIFMPINPEMYAAWPKVDHTDYVRKLLKAETLLVGCGKTIAIGGSSIPFCYNDKNTTRISKKWTYETLFNDQQWPIPRLYPQETLDCPAFNLSPSGQIATGEEVTVTGIYEPWLPINGKVGCPNYFLEGSRATDYQLEGTDEWVDVKWRLIWEDKRYLDGTIPEEEKAYIFDIENIGIKGIQNNEESIEKLSIRAGLVCPKTGYRFTVAQENSRQYFRQGEILPEIKSDWGEVYWYWDGDE